MAEDQSRKRKPPSFAWRHFEHVLPKLRKRAPAQVTTEDVQAWGVTQFKTAEKVVAALKFLGVLGEKGQPDKHAWEAIRNENGALRALVQRAYGPLFSAFDGGIEQVDLTDLRNEIGKQWEVDKGSQGQATAFFAGLCGEAGIPLSTGARDGGASRQPVQPAKARPAAPRPALGAGQVGPVVEPPLTATPGPVVLGVLVTGRESQAELEVLFAKVKQAWAKVWG